MVTAVSSFPRGYYYYHLSILYTGIPPNVFPLTDIGIMNRAALRARCVASATVERRTVTLRRPLGG